MSEEFDMTLERDRASRGNGDSRLSLLREKLAAKTERPTVLLPVPQRESIMIRVSPNVRQGELRGWRKQAGEDTKQGMDPTKFSVLVLANTCRGVFIDDQEVLGDSGQPLTFASPEIKDMLDADTPMDAVRTMFGVDAHIEAAAMAILEASGFGDTVDVVPDPLAN